MKHNVEELNTQVSDLKENSKNMSDLIQETSKNNQLRIQTLQLNLNKNLNKTETHDVLLESMKKMLENLSTKQNRLEEENQELKQKIINMEGELTLLQSTTLCEKNWTSFNSHCYLFTPDKQSFDVALEACTSENSYLVEINSEAESKFLAQLNIWSYPSILIGATNIQEGYKGTFVYQESKLAVPEKFWNVGEPNNARGDEHCVEMFTVEEVLKFNDVPCSWSFPFVCETPGALVAQ